MLLPEKQAPSSRLWLLLFVRSSILFQQHDSAKIQKTYVYSRFLGCKYCPSAFGGRSLVCVHSQGRFIWFSRKLLPLLSTYKRVLLYHEVYPKSILGRFIKYQLGDLLWAYSLECSIALSTGNSHKALYYGLFWAIVTECFQLLPRVHATFDIWDIIAQIAGVLIAYWIVQKFYHYQLYTFSKDSQS